MGIKSLKGKYLVTKKVTVEHIYNEIIGVLPFDKGYVLMFADGSRGVYTENEVKRMMGNKDPNAYISDTLKHADEATKIYFQAPGPKE